MYLDNDKTVVHSKNWSLKPYRPIENTYNLVQLKKDLDEFLDYLFQVMKRFFELSLEFMNLFNQNRLFWVWGSSLLNTVFNLLPHLEKATNALNTFGTHSGRTSWVLYYFRLFFNLCLMATYTIDGGDIRLTSKEKLEEDAKAIKRKGNVLLVQLETGLHLGYYAEDGTYVLRTIEKDGDLKRLANAYINNQTYQNKVLLDQALSDLNIHNRKWTQRLQEQWTEKKFIIINDVFWGPGNMACFFWLTSKNNLGTPGDILTTILLLLDLSVAIWDYFEQRAEYHAKLERLEQRLADLQSLGVINDLGTDERSAEIIQINNEITACKKEWDAKSSDLIRNIVYSLAMLIVFTLMAFCPGPLSIAATVLCFAFTLANNITNTSVSLSKAYEKEKEAEDNYNRFFADTLRRYYAALDTDPNKEALAQELIELDAEFYYQQDMVSFKILQMAPVIVPQLIIAPLVFGALFFAPAWLSFPVLVGIVVSIGVVAAGASWVLNRYEPQKEDYTKQSAAKLTLWKPIPETPFIEPEETFTPLLEAI